MDRFLTVEQVSDLLQVSKMTIYRYIAARKFKAHKIGKEFRIPKREFDRFLKATQTHAKR